MYLVPQDYNTVAWAAGTITFTTGAAYSISGGNTGNISAITYIYLDIGTSTTVLQTTTTAATAVGSGKVIVAVAEDNDDNTSDATFQVFGGIGGMLLTTENLAANTITANEILANTITASEIFGNTITTNEITVGTLTGVELAATAKITAGTGNNVGILDGVDGTYRIYAGHATAGSAPFRVTQAGALTATSATITGSVTATSGAVGGWDVGATSLSSGAANITLDSSGKKIYINDGTFGNDGIQLDYNSGNPRAYIGDGANAYLNFDGTKITWKAANTELDASGNLTATSGSFSGSVTSTSGTIGGWTLAAGSLSSGAANITLDSSGKKIYINDGTFGNDGIQLDYNSGNPRAYIGDGANAYLNFDGTKITWKAANTELDASGDLTATSATITGSVTATSGAIGGWTIGATTLTGGDLTLDSDNTKITAGTGDDIITIDAADADYRLAIGDSTYADAPFSVSKAGALIATTATIQSAAGAGQRMVISSADNTMKWYDPDNNLVITIDDNVYGAYPGVKVENGGVFYAYNSATNFSYINAYGIHVTTDGSTSAGSFSCPYVGGTTSGVIGDASTAAANADPHKRYGVKGLNNITNAGNDNWAIGVYGIASSTGGGPVYSGYFAGGDFLVNLGDSIGANLFQVAASDHDVVFQVNSFGYIERPVTGNIVLKLGDAAGADGLYLYDSANATMFKVDSNGNTEIYNTAKIGDGGTTNYAQFAADGELTLHGTARVEKYMTIGAAALIKGTAPPDEGTIGVHAVLLFASNLTESAYYEFHIPPDWASGTDVKVAVYWCPTTNDAGKHVAWELDWEARHQGAGAAGEIIGAGSTNAEMHDDTYAGANNLQETPYATISGASLATDDTVGMCISRDHDDGDDYGSDTALLHIEIEYISDKLGKAT